MEACGGQPNKAVVAVIGMEESKNSNVNDTICSGWGGEGGIGGSDSRMIILGDSS